MEHIEVDVNTGQVTKITLTPDQEAAVRALAATQAPSPAQVGPFTLADIQLHLAVITAKVELLTSLYVPPPPPPAPGVKDLI
jgi:hypothetical protein